MKIQRAFEITTIFALVLLIITFCVVSFVPKYTFTETTYVVRSGDCLWTIAEQYCPDSLNVWDYIHRVCDANGLTSYTICPGQVLTVFEVSVG
jgi:nucleoid-associated protein YgaU